jgi:hypothetical protein
VSVIFSMCFASSARTWATIETWTKRCITGHQFEVTGERMKQFRESWFASAQSCKEDNSEAFAGQHAATSTSFYVFDEASAVLTMRMREHGHSRDEWQHPHPRTSDRRDGQ